MPKSDFSHASATVLPAVRFCDEFASGFGWVEAGRLERCGHALASGGNVWVVDPIEGIGVEERIRRLGEPAAVLQLLDRHDRAGAGFAERLGVPLHRVPVRGIDGTPFEVLDLVSVPRWREVALWWPGERTLVCADALGTASYFRAPGDCLAVHPMLRLTPPRRLRGLAPARVLVGHGEGIHGDEATPLLEQALATARRRIPRWLVGQVK